MEKTLKFLGGILLVAVVIFGVLYLLDIAGITKNLQPGELLSEFFGGVQGALTGIQVSISRMLGSFTNQ